MTIYRAQSGVGGEARTHGLYDADCVIVVVGHHDALDPRVTVDHEITHITLSKRSSLGLLRHVLASTHWLARAAPYGSDFEQLAPTVAPLLAQLHAIEEPVHEAVAWLGTALLTQGREDLRPPAAYRPHVDRLRGLLESCPGAPLDDIQGGFDRLMNVAEAVGVTALSPPSVGRVLQERTFRLLASGEFRQPAEEPTARMEAICAALRARPFSELERWSDSLHDPDLPGVLLRSAVDGDFAAVCGLMRSVLAGSFAPTMSDDQLQAHWEWFVNRFIFDERVDRYAQVHVISGRDSRTPPWPVHTDDRPPAAVVSGFAVGVSRSAADARDDIEWSKPHSVEGLAVYDIHDSLSERSIWEVRDADRARAFLRAAARELPVIVNGVGYDAAVGDFRDVPVLSGIPHVVTQAADFRTFWLGHAVNGAGLFGSREIEWLPMPSPSHPDSPFGFIVLKGAGAPSPIYVMPCVVGQYERVVSPAEQFVSPTGVRLVHVDRSPYEWLGGMGGAVVAAGRAWESQVEGAGTRP